MNLTWTDAQPLGEILLERYDNVDPRTVRLVDLRKWVLDLEDFEGKPDEATEPVLETVRAAWFEQWRAQYDN